MKKVISTLGQVNLIGKVRKNTLAEAETLQLINGGVLTCDVCGEEVPQNELYEREASKRIKYNQGGKEYTTRVYKLLNGHKECLS